LRHPTTRNYRLQGDWLASAGAFRHDQGRKAAASNAWIGKNLKKKK
jgi:hypothetical protein